MNDEDFVMGYAVGYNDGVGSGGGGSGGIIINEGTSIYDVPIIQNYNLIGTDFGFATFDLNECAFMNKPLNSSNTPKYYTNPITKEIVTYVQSPRYMDRRIGYAVTKGGKAIGIFNTRAESYSVFSDGNTYEYIEDGSLYPKKDTIKAGKIENPVLTWTESPYGDNKVQLKVYMEYDVVTETVNYSQPKSYRNEEYGFNYYLKSDLDAQNVTGTTSSTSHRKIQIYSNASKVTALLEGDTYPKEWLNKYRFEGLGYPLFGINIMDDYELSISLFDGIA